MNPSEVLRIVDAIHRDKNIEKEFVFQAIEFAMLSAAKKHYGEEDEITVEIDREDGTIQGSRYVLAEDGTRTEKPIDTELVGRIGAQTAKQVIIQKIREAERDALYDEYEELIGLMVSGVVQRYEGGVATVQLANVEAILPRSEQIPGETHHTNERVRATVFEVRKQGSRVKVVLSRIRPQLVARLFEQEIPEIAEGVIEVRQISREPGYRSKVAVSSSDQRVDCVGACVGVRGNRIKNIVEELAGERIDIVRWNEDLQELIPNALQPAEVEDSILCQMLGRAIVLVREDQLSLAIGRRGQNVRLASKLCGWDIELMTREELDEQIDRAVAGFSEIEGVDEKLAMKLVEEGYMSYADLTIIEPDDLMAMGELTTEQVDHIVEQAEVREVEAEKQAKEERQRRRTEEAIAAAQEAEAAANAAEETAAANAAEETSQEASEEASPTSSDVAADESDEQTAAGETEAGETEAGETEAGETEAGEAEAGENTTVEDDSSDSPETAEPPQGEGVSVPDEQPGELQGDAEPEAAAKTDT